jgi:hypothetical protein
VLNRGSPNRSDSNYRSRSFVIRQLFWWSAVNPNLSHYCGTSSYRLSVTACWINSCVTAARPGIIRRFSFKLLFFTCWWWFGTNFHSYTNTAMSKIRLRLRQVLHSTLRTENDPYVTFVVKQQRKKAFYRPGLLCRGIMVYCNLKNGLQETWN